jgi:hypothetical protein
MHEKHKIFDEFSSGSIHLEEIKHGHWLPSRNLNIHRVESLLMSSNGSMKLKLQKLLRLREHLFIEGISQKMLVDNKWGYPSPFTITLDMFDFMNLNFLPHICIKMNMQRPTFLHIRLKNPTISVMKLAFRRPSEVWDAFLHVFGQNGEISVVILSVSARVSPAWKRKFKNIFGRVFFCRQFVAHQSVFCLVHNKIKSRTKKVGHVRMQKSFFFFFFKRSVT